MDLLGNTNTGKYFQYSLPEFSLFFLGVVGDGDDQGTRLCCVAQASTC